MNNAHTFDSVDSLSVTTLRLLAADMVEKANSGHPGLPLGAAPMAYVLWRYALRHSPSSPLWFDRDRFVLSAGHGSALLYSLLHLSGYNLPLEELKRFRQWQSKTPGHPEFGHTAGVETTTGPLGQGLANAVGMALAEKLLAQKYNKPGHEIINHRTFVIAGDGDMMEGITQEAVSLAGHLKLNKIIVLYDDNSITIEGKTELAFSEDIPARFRACGWNALAVADGNSLPEIQAALSRAVAETEKPTIICVKTCIGCGSPRQDSEKAHGEPLGAQALKATREFYKWPDETFYIPPQAAQRLGELAVSGETARKDWENRLAAYAREYPAESAELASRIKGEIPADLAKALPDFSAAPAMATREASGKAINALAEALPGFYGGSADLAPSNKTAFLKYPERTLHFGIREHSMAAAVNGMALHGGFIPFGATFLVFADYMRPSLRLAALMKCHSIFVFTHDSIGVGEDGPTHQPVEQLSALRVIPGLTVLRPADARETAAAWEAAVARKGPVCLALTRQKLPPLDTPADIRSGVLKGAYVVADCAGLPEIIILASGSEVQLAVAAAKELNLRGKKTRAVSMPSMEIFAEQPREYRDGVLPPAVTKRLAVEAASPMSWHKWTGSGGGTLCIETFGASAPAETVFEKYGFTVQNTVKKALEL